MYCSACGQPMERGQTFCQKCGRQSTPIASYAQITYPYNRVHRHMQAMAILWIVYTLWILLHWVIAVGFLAGAFTNWAHSSHGFDGLYAFPFFHATWLVPIITTILVGRALLCLVTGISLLRRASWARILAIVTAFLALIHPITGTVLGIYTLWVLLPFASGQEYEQMTGQALTPAPR
jgi:hypothetical protein